MLPDLVIKDDIWLKMYLHHMNESVMVMVIEKKKKKKKPFLTTNVYYSLFFNGVLFFLGQIILQK